ncbi:MAG: hypothetical protein ACO1TE_06420 [Prosthecobacter sp.]
MSLAAKAAGALPPTVATVTGLQATLDAKAPMTRSIGVGGLATGGGDLGANRTITVPPASQAEAEAGTDNTKAMTPLRVAQAIEALGGGGGDSILSSGVFYVMSDGDDGTAQPGNPALPYATVQAAFEAWTGTDAPGTLVLGVGTFGSLTLTGHMSRPLAILGMGRDQSMLTGIHADGAEGAAAEENQHGNEGQPGWTIDISGNKSVHLGPIYGQGGAGGTGGHPIDGATNGGAGGAGSHIRLRGCVAGSISTNAGNGGLGVPHDGSGDTGGPGAQCGSLWIEGCHIEGGLYHSPGGGGNGSISGPAGEEATQAVVVGNFFTADMTVCANSGIVAHNIANPPAVVGDCPHELNTTHGSAGWP